MEEHSPQDEPRADEAGELRRTTEQGDELTEEHSIAQRQNRAKTPYMPPRQPSQDPPSA